MSQESHVVEDYYEYRNQEGSFFEYAQTPTPLLKQAVIVGLFFGSVASVLMVFARASFRTIVFLVVGGALVFTLLNSYYLFRYAFRQQRLTEIGCAFDWDDVQPRFFGTDSYYVLRADPGDIGIMDVNTVLGFSNSVYRRVANQRSNAKCKVCGDMLFSSESTKKGGYIVEKHRRWWVGWIPVTSSVVLWASFCPEHKPTKASVEESVEGETTIKV